MQKDVFARSVADCLCKNWKLPLSGKKEREKGEKVSKSQQTSLLLDQQGKANVVPSQEPALPWAVGMVIGQ